MKNTKMLKKNYEFKNVFNKGKFHKGKYITAIILKNRTEQNLLGLAISTKIGDAVTRNHIKRLFRESYKNLESSLKSGYTIIFVWNKAVPTEQALYKNIKKDMEKILLKAGILDNKNEEKQ